MSLYIYVLSYNVPFFIMVQNKTNFGKPEWDNNSVEEKLSYVIQNI